VQGFDMAGNTVVMLADSAVHPARVLARHGDGEVLRLESFNDPLLAGVAFGEVQEVNITGALGEAVQTWLVFPPGFDAKKKHPVTHVIHGGPFAAAGDTFGWRWNPHIFAAAGHVIAQVNYHGSSGFGFQFRDSLIGRQGELELQDIEAATDWLLQQRWADASRVFATGGSYGGFLVAWMNGHVAPGRYRAYVCHAGVYDRVATFSADSYTTRPKDLGAKYWEDPARVAAQSPHHFAAAMTTPTLVTHGAQDFRVPDCNGLAYYNTLKAKGVDARLLWFPDENHWVLKPRNSRLWYAEFAAWLARHSGSSKKVRK
jgi:dipeptidyl aminopeptidase/acylaminoacyl peptidase